MGEKSAGVGLFHIPTAPAALTATAQSGSANTYGSAVSFGNSPSAMYIVAVNIGVSSVQIPTYVAVQILIAGSIVGEVLVGWGVGTGATGQVISGRATIWPPIPVANAAAITVKTASSVASAVAWGVSLECIAQTNVVDDAVAETSNVTQLLGTAWLTPAVAGTPDVNAKQHGGTNQTGRDIGASVLLSTGSGAGQLDFTSGVVKANLAQILGTALTETAGQLAAAFKKVFDVASATFTALSVNQTGDAFARLGAPAGASVSADVAAVKTDTAAVKVQTDKLAFTVANQVDANTLKIGGTTQTARDLGAGVLVSASQVLIKKNVALANFMFVMTDATSHAPKTGLTVTTQVSIDGGAFGATVNAAAEVGSGWYKLSLAAADMNGTVIALRFSAASADDTDITIVTQA